MDRVNWWKVLLSSAVVLGFAMAPGVLAAEEGLPPGGLTLGGRLGDHYASGVVDILVPVWGTENGLLFINPRGNVTDDDSEEVNLGIGYRYMIPDMCMILGVNAYYDSNWSSYGNHFNQLGLGLEMLTQWVDARFNYYLPQDDEESIGKGGGAWGVIAATGHTVIQQRSEIVEKAREGWDAEIGVKMPVIDKWADVRAFVGYYDWQGELGSDDLAGFKGRLEIKPMPGLSFDAELYEDEEVLGSDWYVGARVRVPFNIGNAFDGRNPFEGTKAAFSICSEKTFADRMTEMVIRDQYIQTTVGNSDDGEIYVLADDVVFVSKDGNPGAAGTAEDPLNRVRDGADRANAEPDLGNVFVFDSPIPFEENVVLEEGIGLWGRAEGMGGLIFGPEDIADCPIIDGMGLGPAVTVCDDSSVNGFVIRNTDTASPAIKAAVFYSVDDLVDISRVGVYGANCSDISIADSLIAGNSIGILIHKDGRGPGVAHSDFFAELSGVTVQDNDGVGAMLLGHGGSGVYDVTITDSVFNRTGGTNGLQIGAFGYDSVDVRLANIQADENGECGVVVDLGYNDWNLAVQDNSGSVNLYVDGLSAYRNQHDGAAFLITTSGTGAPIMANLMAVSTCGNFEDGLDLEAYSYGDDSPISLVLNGIEANENESYGIDYAYAETSGENSPAYVGLFNVVANGNDDSGVYAVIYTDALNSDAELEMQGIQANDSLDNYGIYAYLESSFGGAMASLSDAVACGNYYENISLEVSAYGVGAPALATFTNVQANNSSDYEGIYTSIYSDDGPASLSFTNVEASNNYEQGIYAEVEAYGVDHDVLVNIDNAMCHDNKWDYGIYVYAIADAGAAEVNISNVDDSGSHDGINIEAYAYGADAPATVNLTNIISSNIVDYYGVSVHAESYSGAASVNLLNVETINCFDEGVDMDVYAHGTAADASVSLINVRSEANSADGIFVYLHSDDGDANLSGQNVVSADNNFDGIEVYAEAGDAYNLDLGGGSLGSLGLNSWYGNGEYGVNNAGGGTVFALDNWWGVALPVSGTDHSAAGVDASNPLATDPN